MLISLASYSINEPGQAEGVAGDAEDVAAGHFLPKHEPGEAEGVAGDAEDVAAG